MNVVQRGQKINSKNLGDLLIECEKSMVINYILIFFITVSL